MDQAQDIFLAPRRDGDETSDIYLELHSKICKTRMRTPAKRHSCVRYTPRQHSFWSDSDHSTVATRNIRECTSAAAAHRLSACACCTAASAAATAAAAAHETTIETEWKWRVEVKKIVYARNGSLGIKWYSQRLLRYIVFVHRSQWMCVNRLSETFMFGFFVVFSRARSSSLLRSAVDVVCRMSACSAAVE